MDSAMMKKSPQIARSKATMMAQSPDPKKKKGAKKNRTQAQSGGCVLI